jgi:hypothetical protein
MGSVEGWVAIKEPLMKEILLFVVIVGLWYLVQGYILPKLGVST